MPLQPLPPFVFFFCEGSTYPARKDCLRDVTRDKVLLMSLFKRLASGWCHEVMTQVTRTILQYAMTVKIRESNSAERTQFFSRKIPRHSLISVNDKTNGRIAHTRTKSWGQSRRTSLKFRARVYLAISFISEWNFKIFAAVSVNDIATQCFRGRCKIYYIITMDNTP